MKLKDICMICSPKLGEYTCKSCGTLVCKRDYNKETGFCIRCSQER